MRYTNPQLRTLLAGEYALGVLAPTARRRFQRLLLTDAGLQNEVLFWEQHLAQWAAGLKPVMPDGRVWQRISNKLDTLDNPSGNNIWRWGTALSAAAALVLAVALFTYTPPVAPVFTPTHAAVFSTETGQPVWIIEADLQTGEIHLQALAGATPPDKKSYELWMLPAEGKPVSLGLMPIEGAAKRTLTTTLLARLTDAKGLAISLEPTGGSPTGLPTGPVVYTTSLVQSG